MPRPHAVHALSTQPPRALRNPAHHSDRGGVSALILYRATTAGGAPALAAPHATSSGGAGTRSSSFLRVVGFVLACARIARISSSCWNPWPSGVRMR